MFITIEGIEGSGKSTNATFITQHLSNLGVKALHTREPGGTPIAEQIRAIFLDKALKETITAQTELLLLFAARSQHLENLIIPSLNAGNYVVCERFTDASFAYQGGGRNVDLKYISFLENFVQMGLSPDLIVLFDVDVSIALNRIKARGSIDRIEEEKADFFERVRKAYLERARSDPNKYYIINANLDLAQVRHQITDMLSKTINVSETCIHKR